MKRLFTACSLLMVILVSQSLATVQVNVTHTGDNVTSAFYQDGAAPVSIGVGSNASNWTNVDTAVLYLDPSDQYQLIFRVNNNVNEGYNGGNPAAFLAEITGGIAGGSSVTSSAWEYAIDDGTTPTNFNALSWAAATEYGYNGEPGITWTHFNGGAVSGISATAQWIWSDVNYGDLDPAVSGPADYNYLWLRTTITTIPEPGSLIVWSLLGALGITVSCWRRRGKAFSD
jgi:hypothetical protein